MNDLSVIPMVEKIIENKKNVLIEGPHGCGKSHTVRGIANAQQLTVAIFNCATMDPYIDFVGIPMPVQIVTPEGETIDNLKMVRPHTIDMADIIFFDEVNRAQSETLNGVLEIVNERSVNGEPLPNLKSTFAAMNPLRSSSGTYKVNRLDDAFIDRFDHYFKIDPEPDHKYLSTRYDPKVVEAISRWWTEHKSDGGGYVSPRRLVKATDNYFTYNDKSMFSSSFQGDAEVDKNKLWDMLQEATGKSSGSRDRRMGRSLSKARAEKADDEESSSPAGSSPTSAVGSRTPVLSPPPLLRRAKRKSALIAKKPAARKKMLPGYGISSPRMQEKMEVDWSATEATITSSTPSTSTPSGKTSSPLNVDAFKSIEEIKEYVEQHSPSTQYKLKKRLAQNIRDSIFYQFDLVHQEYRYFSKNMLHWETAKWLNETRKRGDYFNITLSPPGYYNASGLWTVQPGVEK